MAELDRNTYPVRKGVERALEPIELKPHVPEAIERRVRLHGRKPRGVVLEPFGLSYAARIEGLAPVAVLPAGRSDEQRHISAAACTGRDYETVTDPVIDEWILQW